MCQELVALTNGAQVFRTEGFSLPLEFWLPVAMGHVEIKNNSPYEIWGVGASSYWLMRAHVTFLRIFQTGHLTRGSLTSCGGSMDMVEVS
jgi:hypothetical protein